MSPTTRKAISWTSLVLAAALGGAAFWAARARAAMERQLAVSKADGDRLRAAWRARPAPQIGGTGHSVTQTAVAPAGAGTATAPSFPPRTRAPGLSDLAKDNPQLWNEFVKAKRVEMGRFYLPVMQRLNLTPVQRERVKDILADDLARSADINTAGNVQGLPFEDPVLVKLREESTARRKRELTEALGEMGAKELEDFERVTPMRGAVDGFAVQVARVAPLTRQQADQLERVLAQANTAFRKGEHGIVGALDWTEADRGARGILTPQQFELWKLGVANNSFGGARIEQELHRTYDRAIERTRGGDGKGDAK